jgi:hypothetical protein
MVRNAHLANSEPLLIALLLGAAIRLADRDHAGAFGLGVAVGLLRPEAWPFLGVYGLWLLVRRGLPARATQTQRSGARSPASAKGVVSRTGSGFQLGPSTVERSNCVISRPQTIQAHGS